MCAHVGVTPDKDTAFWGNNDDDNSEPAFATASNQMTVASGSGDGEPVDHTANYNNPTRAVCRPHFTSTSTDPAVISSCSTGRLGACSCRPCA